MRLEGLGSKPHSNGLRDLFSWERRLPQICARVAKATGRRRVRIRRGVMIIIGLE